jgi:anti-sigma B factor antagonist
MSYGAEVAMTDVERVRPPEFQLAANFNGQGCTIRLAGELDAAVAARLELALTEAQEAEAKRIVVDVEELSFIDSAGIQALVGAKRSADSDGWEFVLARPAGHVRRIFDLAALDKVVTIVED